MTQASFATSPTCLTPSNSGTPCTAAPFQDQLQITCATHNYERGVDLVAIQQMLGHWQIGTTMRYVSPSATFVEDAWRRAVSGTLGKLAEEDDGR